MRQIDEAGWPSGETIPALILGWSPHELGEKYGVTFNDFSDDLGVGVLAVVEFSNSMISGLIRYEGNPAGGTAVYVPRGMEMQSSIEIILRDLGISKSELEWLRE